MPSPTPSADEAVDAFFAFVNGDELPMRVDWEGRISAPDHDLMTVTAHLDDAGSAEAVTSTVMREDTTRNLEYVRIGDTSYERDRDGTWWLLDRGGSYRFTALFEGIRKADVEATAEDDGWLLTIPPIDISAQVFEFAIADGTIEVTTTDYTIRIDSAGMPISAHMVADVAITAGDTAIDAVADFEWNFSDIGEGVPVDEPDEALRRHVDLEAYTAIGYPGTWEFVEDDGGWIVGSAGFAAAPWVVLTNDPRDPMEIVTGYEEELELVPLGREEIEMDGVPGLLTTYAAGDYEGEPMLELQATAVLPLNGEMRRLQVITIQVPEILVDDAREQIDLMLANVIFLDPLLYLPEGTCYESVADEAPMDVQVVPCEDLHDGEIYEVVPLAEADTPGSEAIASVRQACEAAFEPYVGIGSDETSLRPWVFGPDQQEWEAGTRTAVCAVSDPAGDGTIGTLQGSGR